MVGWGCSTIDEMRFANGNDTSTIAVLGAGIQGVTIAMELASRGLTVELFDCEPIALSQASYWNEGKIHLGYIYANDEPRRTAYKMLLGALTFFDFFERHDISLDEHCISEPFIYAVHKNSLKCPDECKFHYDSVDNLYNDLSFERKSLNYPRLNGVLKSPKLSKTQLNNLFDDKYISAAFQTQERSINTKILAEKLKFLINDNKYIVCRFNHEVSDIQINSDRFSIISNDGLSFGSYKTVINALWANRLKLDASVGIRPNRPWMFRYKLALHTQAQLSKMHPSTSIVSGGYGDAVKYSDGSAYYSWYPAGKILQTGDISGPGNWTGRDRSLDGTIRFDTIENLISIAPYLEKYTDEMQSAELAGGTIFNWGEGDVNIRASEVHQRFDIGIARYGNYYSVDTGKYTMAPSFAMELADMITGSHG